MGSMRNTCPVQREVTMRASRLARRGLAIITRAGILVYLADVQDELHRWKFYDDKISCN